MFTLPQQIAALAYQNKAVVYGILFEAAAETLKTIAGDPKHLGGEIGLTAVLHTWGQTLTHHPHVHCIVPGGALSPDGKRWIACRPGYFLPERVLARVFRGLFLKKLLAAHRGKRLNFFTDLVGLAQLSVFAAYLAPLRHLNWVVDTKRPFAGPEQVLRYLSRYTHRVAISNHRLVDVTNEHVTFSWKDYRHEARISHMRLAPDEFIRRFLPHVLPDGFQRIRHYGFLANGHRETKLARIRRLLPTKALQKAPDTSGDATMTKQEGAETPPTDQTHAWEPTCPQCGGTMDIADTLPALHRPRTRRIDTS